MARYVERMDRQVNTKRYAIGSSVQARLSEWNRTHMPHSEQVTARKIIKTLVRTSTDAYSAKTDENISTVRVRLASGGRITLHRGTLTLPDGREVRNVTPADVSVGSQVCACVRKGLLPWSETDTHSDESQSDESQSESQSDSSGESYTSQSDESYTHTEDEERDTHSEDEDESQSVSVITSDGDQHSADYLLKRWREIIRYIESHKDNRGNEIDMVSNAAFKYGASMLAQGIPVDAILDAYAKTWTDTQRESVGIRDYDVTTFGTAGDGEHKCVPYVHALVQAKVPIYLCGPSQAGKTTLIRNLAARLEVPYGMCPLSEGVSISWLFGRNMPKGYIGTDYRRLYKSGGLFLGDEADAADPNLLVGVNESISGDTFTNPVKGDEDGGETIVKSVDPPFVFLTAGNTWGTGADSFYVGRNPMDGALRERIRMGRVLVAYDRELQEEIFWNTYNAAK